MLFALMLVLQVLSLFVLPFVLCSVDVLMPVPGGKAASVYVASWSFLGVAQTFFNTSSYYAFLLLVLLPTGVGLGATLALYVFWLTPKFSAIQRRIVLRGFLVLDRASLVSVPTMLLA